MSGHYRKKPVFLQDTVMFKNWRREKGYVWPSKPWEQENMMAEFNREGLEEVTKERKRSQEKGHTKGARRFPRQPLQED